MHEGHINFPMHAYGKNVQESVFQELLKAEVLYLAKTLN